MICREGKRLRVHYMQLCGYWEIEVAVVQNRINDFISAKFSQRVYAAAYFDFMAPV
jgi:hypothetical protein